MFTLFFSSAKHTAHLSREFYSMNSILGNIYVRQSEYVCVCVCVCGFEYLFNLRKFKFDTEKKKQLISVIFELKVLVEHCSYICVFVSLNASACVVHTHKTVHNWLQNASKTNKHIGNTLTIELGTKYLFADTHFEYYKYITGEKKTNYYCILIAMELKYLMLLISNSISVFCFVFFVMIRKTGGTSACSWKQPYVN